jgi:hypothetical protein
MDINLIKAVIKYLSDTASVIPVFNGGSGYAYYSYVKGADWNNRAGSWTPEDIWLDK